MASPYTRQTAIPCTLGEMVAGTWSAGAGVEPSGVRCARGFVSRASVIGVIIDKDDGGFTLDDGTTTMSVRSFDAPAAMLAAGVGAIVLVIGRPRDYNAQRYLVLEICKPLRSAAWVPYRRKELAMFAGIAPKAEPRIAVSGETTVTLEVPSTIAKNPYETMIDLIRALDEGQGADVDALLMRYGAPDGEGVVNALKEDGEIFEIRPGRLKILE